MAKLTLTITTTSDVSPEWITATIDTLMQDTSILRIEGDDFATVYADDAPTTQEGRCLLCGFDDDPSDCERHGACCDTCHDDDAPADFTEETWLLFDAEDDEEASHAASVTKTDDGYRVGWWNEAVGLVTNVDFDKLEDAHYWLEDADYIDFTA